MKVLLTAFETFGGQSINSSWEAIKLIEDEIQGTQIIKKTIPVVFNKSRGKSRDSYLSRASRRKTRYNHRKSCHKHK